MWQKSYDGSPCLYLIPTPIGNLDDMTFRSVEILKSVEVIFCEDTRVSNILLNHFDINKKLISLHDHNEDIVKIKLLEYLNEGFSVGLITDRGSPVISDPGFKSVKFVIEHGYNVVGLPGANAFVPALIMSSIAPLPFTFYGFLDSRVSRRKDELLELKYVTNTLIFYESPHRIYKTMELMLDIFGDRDVCLAREISKKFESIYRGSISDLLPTLENIKGEFVVVVSGYRDDGKIIDIVSMVDLYISNGFDKMNAIKMVAKDLHVKKSDVYSIYLKEKEK